LQLKAFGLLVFTLAYNGRLVASPFLSLSLYTCMIGQMPPSLEAFDVTDEVREDFEFTYPSLANMVRTILSQPVEVAKAAVEALPELYSALQMRLLQGGLPTKADEKKGLER
jgi:hypothetical protein